MPASSPPPPVCSVGPSLPTSAAPCPPLCGVEPGFQEDREGGLSWGPRRRRRQKRGLTQGGRAGTEGVRASKDGEEEPFAAAPQEGHCQRKRPHALSEAEDGKGGEERTGRPAHKDASGARGDCCLSLLPRLLTSTPFSLTPLPLPGRKRRGHPERSQLSARPTPVTPIQAGTRSLPLPRRKRGEEGTPSKDEQTRRQWRGTRLGGWPRRTTDQKEILNNFLSTFFFFFLLISWAIFPPSAVEPESKEGKTGKRIDNTKRRTKNEKVRFGQRFDRLSHSWNFEDLHTVLSLFAVILTCRFHGL